MAVFQSEPVVVKLPYFTKMLDRADLNTCKLYFIFYFTRLNKVSLKMGLR